jgi:hypothetical protein
MRRAHEAKGVCLTPGGLTGGKGEKRVRPTPRKGNGDKVARSNSEP